MPKPRPYQKTGVAKMIEFDGRALLADEMGLGKTAQALWFLKRHINTLPAVIVCPATLKYNWQREVRRFIKRDAIILEGRATPKNTDIGNPDIVIINYDILKNWLPHLMALAPETIILDEVTRIKNPKTQQSIATFEMCVDAQYIIGLTGTPIEKSPIDLWQFLNLIDPVAFPSRYAFGNSFCNTRWSPFGITFTGGRNLKKLYAKLRETCMIRRLKKQVLPDLPTKSRHVVPMPIKDYDEYKFARDNFVKWLKARYATKKPILSQQAGYLKRLVAELKLPAIYEWIDTFFANNPGKKLVVFGLHYRVLLPIHERYAQRAVLVNGSVTGPKRQDAIDQFQRNDKVDLFVGNILAAGEGITLTAASDMLIAEIYTIPSKMSQAEDRIHRMTQRWPVNIYYAVGANTVEHNICKTVQTRQRMIDKAIDGTPRGIGNLDIMKELEKEMHTWIEDERTHKQSLPF
jgi:SWI/SNF-related matrix-associated actin-dependent regulator 1 of chromatin subfamily A